MTIKFPRNLAGNTVQRLAKLSGLFFGLFIFVMVFVFADSARAVSISTVVSPDLGESDGIYSVGNSPYFTIDFGAQILAVDIIKNPSDSLTDQNFQYIGGVWRYLPNVNIGSDNLELSSSAIYSDPYTALEYLHYVYSESLMIEITPTSSMIGDDFDTMVGKLGSAGYQVWNTRTENSDGSCFSSLVTYSFVTDVDGHTNMIYASDPRSGCSEAQINMKIAEWSLVTTYASDPENPISSNMNYVGAPTASTTFTGIDINRNWVLGDNQFIISFDYGEPMDNTFPTLTASDESLWNIVSQYEYSWQDSDSTTGIFNYTFPSKNTSADLSIEAYGISLDLTGGLSRDASVVQNPYDVPGVINIDVVSPRVTLLDASYSVSGATTYESSDAAFNLNSVETSETLTGLSFTVSDTVLNTDAVSDATILLPGATEATPFAGNFMFGDDGKFTWLTEVPLTLIAGTTTIYVPFKDQYDNITTSTVTIVATDPYIPPSGGGGSSGGSGGGWGNVYAVPGLVVTSTVSSSTAATSSANNTNLVGSAADGTATTTPTSTPFKGVLGETIDILDTLIAQTKYGMTGKLVAELQTELKRRGFFPSWQMVTGYYGPITKASVERYLVSKGKVLGDRIDIIDSLIAQTKFGQRGQLVSDLQYQLRLRAFFPVWHRITGYYGIITKAAVEKYLSSR